MFLLSETSRPALRLTQPPILWVPGSFPVAERGREVNHLLEPSSEVKNRWKYTSSSYGVDREKLFLSFFWKCW
jgi:hypothetical protein